MGYLGALSRNYYATKAFRLVRIAVHLYRLTLVAQRGSRLT